MKATIMLTPAILAFGAIWLSYIQINKRGVGRYGIQAIGLLNTTLMAAGISTTSIVPDAAKAFISFISSSSAAAVLKASGFQPVDKK